MTSKTAERNKTLKEEGKQLRHYGLRLRAKPTSEQAKKIAYSVDCARFAYNMYLSQKIEYYQHTKKTLSYGVFKKNFNQLKKIETYAWLKVPDKFALECGMEQVDDAYARFFSGQNRFPRFRSKRGSKQSYSTKSTNNNIKLNIQELYVTLPKIGKVKVMLSKKQIARFEMENKNRRLLGATVNVHSSGQTHISLRFEEVVPVIEKVNPSEISASEVVGCDMGLTHFLISSNGVKIENPRYLKQDLLKLSKLQKQLKNKVIGGANYKKMQTKISRLHLHIVNKRKNFLHQVSRKLVDENQVIILEDLDVKKMIKNKKLARSIADVSWAMFKTFVSYKAGWVGKLVILIDRFFPSSKICSGCRKKNILLSLTDRIWVCPTCGVNHDRDKNAALNIKEEGLRLLMDI